MGLSATSAATDRCGNSNWHPRHQRCHLRPKVRDFLAESRQMTLVDVTHINQLMHHGPKSCAPVVHAEPHTPCCSSFETYCGSSNVFENPRLNHAVDTYVVDIGISTNLVNRTGPPPGNWNGDADWDGGGSAATGIVTNGWDTTVGLPGPLVSTGLWPAF